MGQIPFTYRRRWILYAGFLSDMFGCISHVVIYAILSAFNFHMIYIACDNTIYMYVVFTAKYIFVTHTKIDGF